jgi:hypothetical protein
MKAGAQYGLGQWLTSNTLDGIKQNLLAPRIKP